MVVNIKRIAFLLIASLMMFTGCKKNASEKSAGEAASSLSESSSEYSLIVLNPQGSVKKDKVLAPRLDTLEGKKIAMWLTATPDQIYAGKGAELYDILEQMLKEKYSDIEIIRYADLPMKFMPEEEVFDAIYKTQPDAVVAGFGG